MAQCYFCKNDSVQMQHRLRGKNLCYECFAEYRAVLDGFILTPIDKDSIAFESAVRMLKRAE